TRAWRRLRPSCFFFVLSLISIASLAGLASLAADVLVDVADALALVRLGLSPRTDVGGHLADELLVKSEEHTSELQSRENLVCRPTCTRLPYSPPSRSGPAHGGACDPAASSSSCRSSRSPHLPALPALRRTCSST